PQDKARLWPTRVEKDRETAIRELLSKLPSKSRASYLKLWTDLKEKRSKKARLVHQLDKVEMAFQAHKYGKTKGQRKMLDLYETATRETNDPILKRALATIVKN